MLIPYLIIYNFPEFIYHCEADPERSKLSVFFYNSILFILYILFGGILNILYIKHYLRGDADRSGIFILINNIIYALFALIYVIIYFPLQLCLNITILIILIILNGFGFMDVINNTFENSFGVPFFNRQDLH